MECARCGHPDLDHEQVLDADERPVVCCLVDKCSCEFLLPYTELR